MNFSELVLRDPFNLPFRCPLFSSCDLGRKTLLSTWGDVAADLKFKRQTEFGTSPRYDAVDHWSSE